LTKINLEPSIVGYKKSGEEDAIRVLHVDDEVGLLKVSKQVLEMQGAFQVESASSVNEAMKKLNAKQFDVVVSDYQMPIKDGLEFLKELRLKRNTIPFILFTGKGREEVVIEALNLGADRYFNKFGKPATVYGELAHGIRTVVKTKQAEEALQESEEMYRSLFENAGNVTLTLDLKGNVTSINKAAVKYGFKKDEVIGKNMRKFVRKKYWPKLLKDLVQLARGKTAEGKIEINTPKGKKNAEYTSNPIIIDNKVVGVQAVLRDITESKRMEEALQESEENYRSMIEQAPDLIVTIDEKGIVTSCNPALERGTDYSQHEIIGKHFIETPLLHGIDPAYAQRLFNAIIEEKHPDPIELTWFLKDGTPRISEVRIGLMKKEGKIAGFTAVARDITERKKVEEALRESEEKYRELLNGMNDTAWVIDFDGKFVDVNDAAVRVLGYSREELLSMGPPDIDTSLTAEEIRDLIKGMPADKIQVFETAHTTKDGKTIPVEISSSLVTYRGKQAILSIARDITERKKAEQKLNEMMNELVTINEKLGVVGKLTRHDARNKLSVIANNVYLAKQKLAADHTTLEYLGDIESAIGQIEEIFDFARTYEMLGVEELSYMNLEKSVDEAAILFSVMNGVKLVNECQGLTVMADSLLRQLFYNLIDDTFKHGEKASQIRVYYEEGEDQLKLVYEDDGVGIPEDEKKLFFKEGYGKGTGYGLYLIKKMCETYGWAIQETGKPSIGAKFTITIPKTNKNGKTTYRLH